MARRQNVRDRIGMAVYEKKNLNKKLVTMQKSFQEVKQIRQGFASSNPGEKSRFIE